MVDLWLSNGLFNPESPWWRALLVMLLRTSFSTDGTVASCQLNFSPIRISQKVRWCDFQHHIIFSTCVIYISRQTIILTSMFLSFLKGNAATGGCCSKCFREAQKKEEDKLVTAEPAAKSEPIDMLIEEQPAAMEVDEESPVEEESPVVDEKPFVEAPKKRKKKKASYKNMMAGITMSATPTRDIEKEKEGLRKVTGGGAFSKIDKI
jgi:hypothetical protein